MRDRSGRWHAAAWGNTREGKGRDGPHEPSAGPLCGMGQPSLGIQFSGRAQLGMGSYSYTANLLPFNLDWLFPGCFKFHQIKSPTNNRFVLSFFVWFVEWNKLIYHHLIFSHVAPSISNCKSFEESWRVELSWECDMLLKPLFRLEMKIFWVSHRMCRKDVERGFRN